jgi:hypothetical protein
MCNGGTYPPETRGGCVLHGPLHKQILLEWAGIGSQRCSAQEYPCTDPHCRLGYGWGAVLHVFSEHNLHHKSVC